MSGYPPDIKQFMDDVQKVLGFFHATPSIVYSFLYTMLESGDYSPLVHKMPDLKQFSLGSDEALNHATGVKAAGTVEAGKGSYGSTFRIKYVNGIEQIIKRIDVISGPSEAYQRVSVIGEMLIQTYLSGLDPTHACRCQSLRRDSVSLSTFYIGMAPCDKTLFTHIRDEFIRIREEHLDWRTVFTDQYIVNILGHVYHALMSLAPRTGRGGLRFHGDLHPGNIMYREDGFPHEAVLIDFASSQCELSNGIVIGPFVDAISLDMLTLCASLNQLFVKSTVEIPILTELLRPVDVLLRSTGGYNWHYLKSGLLTTAMISGFKVEVFRDYLSSRVVPSHLAFPHPVTIAHHVDPVPDPEIKIATVESIPMHEEGERTPPPSHSASAAAHVSYTAPTHELPAEVDTFVSGLMATNHTNRSRRNRQERHKERHNRRKTRRNRRKTRRY